jgi:hypothetical protein
MHFRVLWLAIVIGLSASPSFGALGDSIEEAFKRYGGGGERIYFSQSEGRRIETIRWDHWFSPDIEVSFDNGVAYRVRVVGNLGPSKWNYYLEVSAQDRKWTLFHWSAEDDGLPVEWKRDDGARARYSNKTLDIVDSHHKDLDVGAGLPR